MSFRTECKNPIAIWRMGLTAVGTAHTGKSKR